MAEQVQTPEQKKKDKDPTTVPTYWRNISQVDQVITAPDDSKKTVPPGVLVHEDQFVDPKVLPKMKGIFVKVPDIQVAAREKEQRKLVVGGKHNTAVGHYQTNTAS